jgi:alpha-amylase
MVLHSHQPVGNFDFVFAEATRQCYRPVVEILRQYPDFHVGLHFSGPLLKWLAQNDRELLAMIGGMYDKGQVELLSGAFYEPLLVAIPPQDAQAQLARQAEFLQKQFKAKLYGFWLAERIWEPALPLTVAASGLKYTIVDDTHFYYAGLEDKDMFGYHLTERAGNTLALFPTNKELRYHIPFHAPAQSVEFLKSAFEQNGPTCATYGDDCEKFGLWPKTYKLVIENGWLKNFIEAILGQSSWLRASTPHEFMEKHGPRSRVYLPNASYEEMMMWALPWSVELTLEELVEKLKERNQYEDMRRFLRGGLWENFLVKYRESNIMHKKMLHLSGRLQKQPHPQAYDHLLQAQCNCSYWHGLFGGLYLSHIRHAVHANLIAAEKLLDASANPGGAYLKSEKIDFDLDGYDEVMLTSPELDCAIHPAYGGSVSLLNLRRHCFNVADTLTRRPEAYHQQFEKQKHAQLSPGAEGEAFSPHDKIIFKEEGLENFLIYDWYQRSVFQDHIMPLDSQLQPFIAARFTEWGDFVDQPYHLRQHGVENGVACCRMRRCGNVWAPGGPWPLQVNKDFSLSPQGELGCQYKLCSDSADMPAFIWAVELNLTLLSASDDLRCLTVGGRKVSFAENFVSAGAVSNFSLLNCGDGFKLDFLLDREAGLWCWPVYTVNQSESGLERTFQGSSLLLLFPLPGGAFTRTLSLKAAAAVIA